MASGPTRSFQELVVWQKSHSLVLNVYRETSNFPKYELYGITSQLRRAAVSVPANIAEGYRKLGLADKVRYFNIAQGSLEEVRYYLILSRDLQYVRPNLLDQEIDEVARLLATYLAALRRRKGS